MAQKKIKLDVEALSCSMCLDLLKDPVTIPCGHSYCMNCIIRHWDEEDNKGIHSCPQCTQTFTPRPVLVKNILLAELVEDLKKTGHQAAPSDLCYAGPEDVSCDVCTGRKLKAIKSCLVCLASYCEKHLQPHYDVAPLKKHKLVEPSKKLQENICSLHNEVMKIFCHTDQQSICYLCLMDQHKGHDTVSAAAERTEKQKELEGIRLNIQQRIQNRQKDVKELQQQENTINVSADKTVQDSEKMFTEMIPLIQKRRSDVKQQIRSQQETEVSRVKELQEKLEQEITELKRKDGELEQLSHTEDHNQFLHSYPSVSALSESPHSSTINIPPLRHFEDVTAAVSETREKLQDVLRDNRTNISLTRPEPKTREKLQDVLRANKTNISLTQPEPKTREKLQDVLRANKTNISLTRPEPKTREKLQDVLRANKTNISLTRPEPKTREEFLQYSCEITLDPNTAHRRLLLSEGNRKVTLMKQQQSYSDHPDRFTGWFQVLSRESLTGRCYWEVEWRGRGAEVAVTYKNFSRAGVSNESGFGYNNKSWALRCYTDSYRFWHNRVCTVFSGRPSCRVGVYLDHRAGILSFYSVSETMTLLHRVQTTFTQPLHAGLTPFFSGASAELNKVR